MSSTAPVDQLEQLDAELDVAQAARPELQLPGGLGRGDVLLDPASHRLDVLDEVVPARRAQTSGAIAAR